jgi:hypothetical protein|nr:MAG: hypothetical protein [Caudoviricetes sp.]
MTKEEIFVSENILLYPYTYLPAKAVKYKTSKGHHIRWFDIDTDIELPPYIGLILSDEQRNFIKNSLSKIYERKN